ncbi:MAG TPA: glycine zipper 2TM domain-containing protein [Longimicrobiales bacterium]
MKFVPAEFRKVLTAILVTVAAMTTARPAHAQEQILSGAIGAAAGLTSGGYVTLAVVVARAQYGHYLHDVEDLIGWQSVPAIIGIGIGAGVGVWDADRMMTGWVYGASGALAGGTVGYLLGPVMWKRPEGKWAGAAIGAGVGMAAGYFLGVLNPRSDLTPGFLKKDAAVVPISVTLSVP